MSAAQNPIDPLSQPKQAPKKRFFESDHKWYLDFLELCRALAGPPVLVSLFLEVYRPEIKALGAAIALGVALVLRFFPKLRRMVTPRKGHVLWAALPWFLTSVLVFVLVFKTYPARSKEQDKLIQQQNKLIQQDNLLTKTWLSWQIEFEKAAGQCAQDTQKVDAARSAKDKADKAKDLPEKEKARNDEVSAERARDACLSEKLKPLLDSRPRPAGGPARVETGELLAGQVMLANHNTSQALWDRMSIDDKFLGVGFSVPQGGDAQAARVPEYLVANLTDKSPEVWHWEIDQGTILNQKPIWEWPLQYVLHNVRPSNRTDFEENWKWMEARLQPNDAPPLLVRFASLGTPSSGCIGRLDAALVFMSNLGELAPKTLAAASLSTGYIKNVKSGEKGVKIHIWVYAPPTPDEVVRATWGTVLANFGKWVISEPCPLPASSP